MLNGRNMKRKEQKLVKSFECVFTDFDTHQFDFCVTCLEAVCHLGIAFPSSVCLSVRLSVRLSVCPSHLPFLASNFKTVHDRALIFHMHVPLNEIH